MSGIQPDAAGTVEIGSMRVLDLKFFYQPLKHIIEAIRAEANVVFLVRWIEIQNVVTRLSLVPLTIILAKCVFIRFF